MQRCPAAFDNLSGNCHAVGVNEEDECQWESHRRRMTGVFAGQIGLLEAR